MSSTRVLQYTRVLLLEYWSILLYTGIAILQYRYRYWIHTRVRWYLYRLFYSHHVIMRFIDYCNIAIACYANHACYSIASFLGFQASRWCVDKTKEKDLNAIWHWHWHWHWQWQWQWQWQCIVRLVPQTYTTRCNKCCVCASSHWMWSPVPTSKVGNHMSEERPGKWTPGQLLLAK